MKRVIPVFVISSLLSSCVTVTQNANQAVNAPIPGASLVAAPPTGAPAQPGAATPAQPASPASPASVSPGSTTPAAPASPEAPATPPPAVKAEFAVFENTIPAPEAVAAYTAADIDQALAAWKNRYEKAKAQPYEVLKMYIDAYLLAHRNAPLSRKLLAVLVTKDTSGSDLDFFVQRAAADPGGRNTFRSYFKGTLSHEQFAIHDFANRRLNVVKNDPAALDKEIQDPNSLTPPNPQPGTRVEFWLQSSGAESPRKVEVLYSPSHTWEVKATSTITLGVS